MRLICPNCDAEYQVDDAAIPETGRDVQCSNCGHAWFQLPADVELAREAEEELFGDTEAAAEIPSVAEVIKHPAPVAPEPVQAAPALDADETDQPESAPRPAAARQTLAESVLSVLREEAQRETAVRREEGPADIAATAPGIIAATAPGIVETQTEFGLEVDAQSASTSAAARHIAKLKGSDPDLQPMAAPKATARRDLLPDIEEINSTLRANSDRVQEEMDEVDALPDLRPRRRSFRSGFVLMMIVAVVLAMAYIMAPRIIAQIPGTAPTMRAYVASVDQARLWLDGLMISAGMSVRNFGGDGN